MNFECCSAFGTECLGKDGERHICFDSIEYSNDAVDMIVFFLSKGSKVVCADFALKALISTWDPVKFGAECPFVQTGEIVGDIKVRFGINTMRESVFPQLSAVGKMAEPDLDTGEEHVNVSSMVMHAMSSTIRYNIKPIISDSINVKVLSVAVGIVSKGKKIRTSDTALIKPELTTIFEDSAMSLQPPELPYHPLKLASYHPLKLERLVSCAVEPVYKDDQNLTHEQIVTPFPPSINDTIATGTDIKGLPTHVEVYFKHFSGVLIVSSLHLVNLTRVTTSSERILSTASSVVDSETVNQMALQLATASLCGPEEALRAQLDLVRSISAISSNGGNKISI